MLGIIVLCLENSYYIFLRLAASSFLCIQEEKEVKDVDGDSKDSIEEVDKDKEAEAKKKEEEKKKLKEARRWATKNLRTVSLK